MRKNITFFLGYIMILMLGITTFIGCGQEVVEPDVMAKAFCRFYILNDRGSINENGIDDAELNNTFDEIVKISKESYIKTQKANFDSYGYPVTKEQLGKLYYAQLRARDKLDYSIETISVEKNKAVLKVKSNSVNITEAHKKAEEYALSQLNQLNSDEKSRGYKFTEIYVKEFQNQCENIKPSDEYAEVEFTMTLQKCKIDGENKKVWIPDEQELGSKIAKIIQK